MTTTQTKNYNLVHIVCEILSLLLVSLYFSNKYNRLSKTVDALNRTLEEHEKRLEEQDKLIKQLIQYTNFYQQGFNKPVSMPLPKIVEEKNNREVYETTEQKIQQEFMEQQRQQIYQMQQQKELDKKSELDSESVLDVELEDEYKELDQNKKKSRSRSRSNSKSRSSKKVIELKSD